MKINLALFILAVKLDHMHFVDELQYCTAVLVITIVSLRSLGIINNIVPGTCILQEALATRTHDEPKKPYTPLGLQPVFGSDLCSPR